MSKTVFTEEEAHKHFAVTFFNKIWPLLEKPFRTEEEERDMLFYAICSSQHWSYVGEPVHFQRGEWMLARVYTVLGKKEEALAHATKCLYYTEKFALKDFDLAYCHEALARAYALAGNRAEFAHHFLLAENAAALIEEEDDRTLFFSDLSGGEWFGMK